MTGIFTIEELGEGGFQSVFPEELADLSANHGTKEDAQEYIDEVKACLLDGDQTEDEVRERLIFMDQTRFVGV
jgi:hypothetical protein